MMPFHGRGDFNSQLDRILQLPAKVDEPGLLVGWSLQSVHEKLPFGFSNGPADKVPVTGFLDPLLLAGEGHLITIAPTGTGKGRCCLIPALLRHEGPVVVIDPKGENYAVTARRRREMGQKVVLIDPFGITGDESDSFNPLDLINPANVEAIDIASAFATALADRSDNDERNAYWYQRATFLLTGLLLHACEERDPKQRNLMSVRRYLMELVAENGNAGGLVSPDGRLFQILQSTQPGVREMLSLLRSNASEGLGSILSMAEDSVGFVRGLRVEECLSTSSFEIDAVTRGDLLSIYLVVPPYHLESHGRLLRLWVMSLVSLLTRRRGRPERSTLFLLDEAAQLGELSELRQAVTLLRGYGVQTWSFWQDVSQLQNLYPRDWQTIVNNSAVLQCFGAQNRMAADGMAALTGFAGGRDYGGDQLLSLNAYEMVLQMGGHQPVVARKPDYLSDPPFAGQFDDNPFHDPKRDIMPAPPARMLGSRLASLDELVITQPPPPRSPQLSSATIAATRQGEDARELTDPLLSRILALWD